MWRTIAVVGLLLASAALARAEDTRVTRALTARELVELCEATNEAEARGTCWAYLAAVRITLGSAVCMRGLSDDGLVLAGWVAEQPQRWEMSALAAATAALKRAYPCRPGESGSKSLMKAGDLLDTCGKRETFSKGTCTGYVRAVLDTIRTRLCIPSSVALADLVRVFRGWVAEGGARYEASPLAAIEASLSRAFQCEAAK